MRWLPGSMAARLFGAEDAFLAAEHDLEDLLDSLYADGWQDWDAEPIAAAINVYGVIPAPSAVTALHRAGFALVYEHDHPASQFVRCACRGRT